MEKKQGIFKRVFAVRGMGQVLTVTCGLVALCAVFGAINPNFLGSRNVANLLRQLAPFLIVGIGQSFVLITGNIDLSIGSVLGMSCMMSATLMCNGVHPVLACLITMVACIATGILNGLLVAGCKLPPFIATLGTMSVARGIAQMVNNNMNTNSIGDFAKPFRDFFYYEKFLGIYTTFWVAIVVWLIFNFILSQTRTGRHLYAIGSNIEAAKLSGVSVLLTTTKAYLVSACCAGLVGLIQCATTGTGTMDAGLSYEMYAVAASVIGGVSTLGGQGILLGTVVGAGVWSVLSNGLQLAGVQV
ncbi:MAG: ABC transporter permease, partial [Clostridia bacterium]